MELVVHFGQAELVPTAFSCSLELIMVAGASQLTFATGFVSFLSEKFVDSSSLILSQMQEIRPSNHISSFCIMCGEVLLKNEELVCLMHSAQVIWTFSLKRCLFCDNFVLE